MPRGADDVLTRSGWMVAATILLIISHATRGRRPEASREGSRGVMSREGAAGFYGDLVSGVGVRGGAGGGERED